MRRISMIQVVGALALSVSAVAGVMGSPISAATCQSWGAQPPSVGTYGNDLLAVTVLSPCDGWAVGYRSDGSLTAETLVEHWNGTTWKVVPSPSPSGHYNYLAGIAATSAHNVWAVGYTYTGTTSRTLVEHWNGHGWKVQPSPNTGSGGGLDSVVAFGPRSAWAAGSTTLTTGGTRELIEHWNGDAWKIQSSPKVQTQNGFSGGIDGSSPRDIWVVGHRGLPLSSASTTLIEHWNGTAWKVVRSPNPSAFENDLTSVSVISSSDAWAVGSSDDLAKPSRTLIEHWNGHTWKVVKSPSPGSGENLLNGVAMTSKDNGWAVGEVQPGPGVFQTLVEHWNGRSWEVVRSQNFGPENAFVAIAADSGSDAWAVGHLAGTVWQVIAVHCC